MPSDNYVSNLDRASNYVGKSSISILSSISELKSGNGLASHNEDEERKREESSLYFKKMGSLGNDS